MFYCTLGVPPVLYELRAKVGDRIAVSEWELKNHFGSIASAITTMR